MQDSSNYDGYANSRYTIAVTGVDHDGSYRNFDGTVTNYSEAGANVLVAAPIGSTAITIGVDTGIGSGIVTTDLTTVGGREVGYNIPPVTLAGITQEVDRDFLSDTTYTSRFAGTSAAAPQVSGVIALMLEANPNLTWRDVQEILVRSARQNDPFGIPSNGAGAATQSPWIVNAIPIFHDPDIYSGDPISDVYRPLLNPNAASFFLLGQTINGAAFGTDHHVATPVTLTNGAGYTVSQGLGPYGDLIGYGHGVVDAELAVRMAEQWGVKNQSLPSELTYTTFVNPTAGVFDLPGAEKSNMDAGLVYVPGGIGGDGGFIDLINEYFEDNPDFTQDFDFRGFPSLQFAVPANNAMSIESVDVKLSVVGDAAAVMNGLRILLVSPEGTYSELNNFEIPNPIPFTTQFIADGLGAGVPLFGQPASVSPPLSTQFAWTFNTNRSWGERSDSAIVFDPLTGEPVTQQPFLPIPGGPILPGSGIPLTQGWQLVIENWAGEDFGLQGVEIAWHGSPITINSQRVQGFVGVDDNRDNLFNYTRVIRTDVDFNLDGVANRLGEVLAIPDLTQESFGSNATVTVRRAVDNVIVDQFVTGHDGNFYFDLVPDDYIIAVEDPLGRAAIDDTLTPNQFVDHYRSEWHITRDYFRVWDHDPISTLETIADANGDPLPWFDGQLLPQTVTYGMKNINFLLDPGPAAPAASRL